VSRRTVRKKGSSLPETTRGPGEGTVEKEPGRGGTLGSGHEMSTDLERGLDHSSEGDKSNREGKEKRLQLQLSGRKARTKKTEGHMAATGGRRKLELRRKRKTCWGGPKKDNEKKGEMAEHSRDGPRRRNPRDWCLRKHQKNSLGHRNDLENPWGWNGNGERKLEAAEERLVRRS